MGASSSGLLDEAKISHVKGLVDNTFQSFSDFYRQQYSVAYFGHLHQEVEPKKEGRGLLLTHRPQYPPEEVLYKGSVKFSCWDEQGKKSRERYVVLRRDYRVEIHDNLETFNRGSAAKLVLQPAGGNVFTTEEESRAHLEKTCAAILNGVKEDSSSVVSSPDVFAVYLHLPYTGHTCFLFQQEADRHQFLSGLKTCIRHRSLDPWRDSSHENLAFARALRLYRQDKGCYECWEMLQGTEEQVLASQVMEEVLPWLQSQLQSRVKGKKTERIRLWLATVQATYSLVLEQLSAALEVLREECRQTASANQALIRSNLDEIMSSHRFLEQKVKACVCEEAEKVCSESVAPYMLSILEALTENISSGIVGMQQILHTQMDSAFSRTNGGTEETKKALSSLSSISLDQSFRQVESLTGKLEDLKQRFGLSGAQRLIHSAHLEMEQLLDSAVYTLEQFLQSSSRLQPSQVPVKLERAKERVLKQLDYDSRVVQRKLYEEALLQITLPSLTRRMDSKWKTELQQFEQHIFSDYSSFILVHNVYDDVLRNMLSKEIETAVQDAASKKSNNLLLDTSDLAISQYSLLGQTPPRSAQGSPASQARRSSTLAAPRDDQEAAAVVEDKSQSEPDAEAKSEPRISQSSEQIVSPVIVVTQQFDEEAPETKEAEEAEEEAQIVTDATAAESSTSDEAPGPPADPESTIQDSPDPPPQVSSTDDQAGCDESAIPENTPTSDLPTSDQTSEEPPSIQAPPPSPPPGADSELKISLGSLSEAIGCSSTEATVTQVKPQQTTDRAVYLSGEIKDNWEVERVKEKQKEAAEKEGDEIIQEEMMEDEKDVQEGGELVNEACSSSGSPAESATASTTECKERLSEEEASSEVKFETREEDEEKLDREEKTEKVEEEVLQSSQPMESQPDGAAELPLDSVAAIRELVIEVTEVETIVTPCPTAAEQDISVTMTTADHD